MLQSFVITLREGLEAFLIVAISLAYLRKSGQRALIPAVHWGIAVSVALSIGLAMLFQRASNQALWEGVLAIAAAGPRGRVVLLGSPRGTTVGLPVARIQERGLELVGGQVGGGHEHVIAPLPHGMLNFFA
jgi:hypothetical protein